MLYVSIAVSLLGLVIFGLSMRRPKTKRCQYNVPSIKTTYPCCLPRGHEGKCTAGDVVSKLIDEIDRDLHIKR